MAAISDSAAAARYKKRWLAAHPGQEKKWSLRLYMDRIAKARKASAGANATRDVGYVDRTKAALAGTRAPTLVKTKKVYDTTVGAEGSPSAKAAEAAFLESRKDKPSLGSEGDAADYTKFVKDEWKGVEKDVPNVNAQARDFRKNVKGSKFSDWEDRVARAEKAEKAGTKSAGYADRTRAQLAAGKVKGKLPSQLKKVATKRAAVTTKPAAATTAPAAATTGGGGSGSGGGSGGGSGSPAAATTSAPKKLAPAREAARAAWEKSHPGQKATTANINAVIKQRSGHVPPGYPVAEPAHVVKPPPKSGTPTVGQMQQVIKDTAHNDALARPTGAGLTAAGKRAGEMAGIASRYEKANKGKKMTQAQMDKQYAANQLKQRSGAAPVVVKPKKVGGGAPMPPASKAVVNSYAATATGKSVIAKAARDSAAADWSKNHGGKKPTTAQINAVVNARKKK